MTKQEIIDKLSSVLTTELNSTNNNLLAELLTLKSRGIITEWKLPFPSEDSRILSVKLNNPKQEWLEVPFPDDVDISDDSEPMMSMMYEYTISVHLRNGNSFNSVVQSKRHLTAMLSNVKNSIDHSTSIILGNGVYLCDTIENVFIQENKPQ